MRRPTVLVVAGIDSGNGAGGETDLRVLDSLGVHGVLATTALTAQNGRGVRGIFPASKDAFRAQLEAVMEFKPKVAKVGMIWGKEQYSVLSQFLEGMSVVVDPVIKAKDGTTLIPELEDYVRYVVPKATLITPNAAEAQALANVKVEDVRDAKEAAKVISSRYGVKYVLVKGGHLRENVDVLYDGERFVEFARSRLRALNTHGTGSVLASAAAAMIAKGSSVEEAVKFAGDLTWESIVFGLEVEHGVGPVNPTSRLHREAERYRVLEEMNRFAHFASSTQNFHLLIPEVSSNLAHSISPELVGGLEDVATFLGRITRYGDGVRVNLPATFGRPTHTARLLLSVIRAGGKGDCLINIRYDETFLRKFREMGYDPLEVDREKEPQWEEGNTMQWLVRVATEERGQMPQVMFDRGAKGKEAMIRFWTRGMEEMMDSLRRLVS